MPLKHQLIAFNKSYLVSPNYNTAEETNGDSIFFEKHEKQTLDTQAEERNRTKKS